MEGWFLEHGSEFSHNLEAPLKVSSMLLIKKAAEGGVVGLKVPLIGWRHDGERLPEDYQPFAGRLRVLVQCRNKNSERCLELTLPLRRTRAHSHVPVWPDLCTMAGHFGRRTCAKRLTLSPTP